MQVRAFLATAALLLLICGLYVGSYLALVDRAGIFVSDPRSPYTYESAFPGGYGHDYGGSGYLLHYRYANSMCSRIFWPLEKLDRRLFPGKWAPGEFYLSGH